MPTITSYEMNAAFAKYRKVYKSMPKEIIEKGCIVFSAYIECITGTAFGLNGNYEISDESMRRLDKLMGPHGEIIMKVWMIQQAHRKPK